MLQIKPGLLLKDIYGTTYEILWVSPDSQTMKYRYKGSLSTIWDYKEQNIWLLNSMYSQGKMFPATEAAALLFEEKE